MAEFDTIATHETTSNASLDTEQPTIRHTDPQSFRTKVLLLPNDDPAMPRRMASYIGRCIEQYGLPVYAHVFYLRPHAGRRDPGYYRQKHLDFRSPSAFRLSEGRARRRVGGRIYPLMPPAGQAEAAWLDWALKCLTKR